MYRMGQKRMLRKSVKWGLFTAMHDMYRMGQKRMLKHIVKLGRFTMMHSIYVWNGSKTQVKTYC